ncbi:modification methylase [Vibrio halioticoli NBRC 102217]|uniref:Cytosine-specific methyltransferase n=1 Tax=Vibrio halioticoli NBRC 102217 TaxID=1219072 RepID=V5HIL8_9VIBR|nr:DNA cytosine methyltransferase [Vibrio halioticoli]GAD89180.1 modification methylase [Vibrio halioticoli NBRC 102217]
MNIKASIFHQIEETIKPLASKHVPEGTEVRAVVEQWLHAIATDSQLFADLSLATPSEIKEELLSLLKLEGLFSTRDKFFNDTFLHLPLKIKKDFNFRFIDLFAGIGGVRLGFQNAGGACVFSSEFDKNAQKTYALNHGDFPFGDITQIDPMMIPDHDVLLGGFPCQAFSVAGYRQGFDDEKGRGNLFFYIYEILKAKKPKAFLLENVKNLQGHDKGKTFGIIKESLKDLGYSVKFKVMNSMEYGNVPQTRERIYIIGFKGESEWESKTDSLTKQFTWPEKTSLNISIRDILEKDVGEIFYYEKYACHEILEQKMTRKDTVYQWRRHYVRENKSNVCPTLTANMGTGGHNVPLVLDDNDRIRKLTPRECSFVQGFPAEFLLPEGVTNSHLYKQFGNSVTVPVVEKIAKEIARLI